MKDSGEKLLENSINSSDHVRKLGNGFMALEAMDFDSRTKSKPALNYDIFRSWNGRQTQLRGEEMAFGLCLSPERSPQFYRSNYNTLSPSSKTRAIESGQRELMEMASQMPESSYELSLRDLVEQPMVLGQQEATVTDERDSNVSGDRGFFTVESNKKKATRAPMSIENGGLYLKMGFPRSVGTTKRKKSKKESVVNTSAKVSPKPHSSADKEWWKRKSLVSFESESMVSSIKSSSSGSGSCSSNDNRRRRPSKDASGGCWSWIFPKYNRRKE